MSRLRFGRPARSLSVSGFGEYASSRATRPVSAWNSNRASSLYQVWIAVDECVGIRVKDEVHRRLQVGVTTLQPHRDRRERVAGLDEILRRLLNRSTHGRTIPNSCNGRFRCFSNRHICGGRCRWRHLHLFRHGAGRVDEHQVVTNDVRGIWAFDGQIGRDHRLHDRGATSNRNLSVSDPHRGLGDTREITAEASGANGDAIGVDNFIRPQRVRRRWRAMAGRSSSERRSGPIPVPRQARPQGRRRQPPVQAALPYRIPAGACRLVLRLIFLFFTNLHLCPSCAAQITSGVASDLRAHSSFL